VEALRELFLTLGLDADESSFATGMAAVEGLKKAAELAVEAFEKLGEFFVDAVKETTEYGSVINDTAARTGIAAATLQELGYAAKLSGSSFEEMSHTLDLLARKMGEAKGGSEEAQKAFAKLGIHIMDAAGNLRASDEVMEDAADALLKLPKGAERTAAAFGIFGRGASTLMPLLAEGKEGIEKFREEARALGLVMDDEAVAAADNFGDSLDSLKGIVRSFKEMIGTELIRELQPVVNWMKEWWKANRELVKQNVVSFVRGLVEVLKVAWEVLKVVGVAVKFLADNWEALAVVIGSYLVAQFVILNASLLETLVGFGLNAAAAVLFGAEAVAAGAAAALAWLEAVWPIALLVAALVLAAFVVNDLWVALNGGDALINDIGPKIEQLFESWFADSENDGWFITALKFAIYLVGWWVKSNFEAIGQLKDAFVGLFNWIVDKWKSLPDAVKGIMKDVAASALGPVGKFAIDHLFKSDAPATIGEGMGGANASPQGWAAATSRTQPAPWAPTINNTGGITVNAAPGQDPKEIAKVVNDSFNQNFEYVLSSSAQVTR
jgi:hypothetical protein